MQQKQFIYWLQTRLRPVVVRLVVGVVVTASLTAAALGILGSSASASNSIDVFSNRSAVEYQLISATKHIQYDMTSPIAAVPEIAVYRSPDCSCCGGWSAHLKGHGFKLKDIPTADIEAVKQKYNVPEQLTSCHTAIVAGYVLEGHVPANDIKRLLKEKPSVAGLSVPQMPVGTPGMEVGNQKDPFAVFSFNRKGKVAVFNEYPST